jgi:acyl-CoA thioester hydrolase
LGDALTVETRLDRLGGASVEMRQTVTRAGQALVRALVKLGCVGRDGRPARMPAAVRQALAAYAG